MADAVVPPHQEPRRRYRQSPGERWWFALLLVPTLLTGLVVLSRGHAIEHELQAHALAALRADGLDGTQVEFNGRKATLRVPTGESEKKALVVVSGVAGVGTVSVEHVARTSAEQRACAGLGAKLRALGHGHGILFSGKSATMTAAGVAALRDAVVALQRCPSVNITVEGHVDSTILGGSTLSLRRAEVVRAALVRAGVKHGRLKAQGFGDTFPVGSNDTPASRALNNRVELSESED